MHSIILGVKINKINRNQAVNKVRKFLIDRKQHYIVTPNPEICLMASKDEEYRRSVLNQADLSLPDGTGLILASFILRNPIWQRISGSDFVWDIADVAEQNNCSIFLLGGKKGAAELTAQNLKKKHHNLKIAGIYDDLFQDKKLALLNSKERTELSLQLIKKINQTQADILLVALGAPEQERWIAENLSKIPSIKLAMAVGGAFDFISGKIKRAPKILRAMGLEWLWRLIQEPKRVKRIFNATFKFLGIVILSEIRRVLIYRKNVVVLIKKKLEAGNYLYLIVERQDEFGHWQLPQGGIGKGESLEQAACREAEEETGIQKHKLKLIKTYFNFFQYKWPRNKQYAKNYKGQKQSLAVFDFLGDDDDKDIKLGEEELRSFKWISRNELVESVHECRKGLVKKIISHHAAD